MSGCRLNGCPCGGFVSVDAVHEPVIPEEQVALVTPGPRLVTLTDAVLFGCLAAVMGLGVGYLAGTVL